MTLTSDVDPGIQVRQYLQPVLIESDRVHRNVGDHDVFLTQQGLDLLHGHPRMICMAENLHC